MDDKDFQLKVEKYIINKEQMSILDKETKILNDEIRKELMSRKADYIGSDKGSVKLVQSKSTKWDEPGLIDYLKSNNYDALDVKVETITSINTDKLLTLAQNDVKVREELGKFTSEVVSYRLTYDTGKTKTPDVKEVISGFKQRG